MEKKVDKLLSKLQISILIGYRFVGGKGGRRLKWWRKEKAIDEAKYLDGKYILVTTLTEPPDEILRIYRSRNRIERAFRITKESIRIRPIFNRKEQHITSILKLSTVGNPANAIFLMIFFCMEILLENLEAVISP